MAATDWNFTEIETTEQGRRRVIDERYPDCKPRGLIEIAKHLEQRQLAAEPGAAADYMGALATTARAMAQDRAG